MQNRSALRDLEGIFFITSRMPLFQAGAGNKNPLLPSLEDRPGTALLQIGTATLQGGGQTVVWSLVLQSDSPFQTKPFSESAPAFKTPLWVDPKMGSLT